MAPQLPARHLALRALAKASATPPPGQDGEGEEQLPDIPLPRPGEMRLFSYCRPGLVAGQDYTITAKQTVTVNGEPCELLVSATDSDPRVATQRFSVVTPQFSLPSEDVHSTYPPQGEGDQPSVSSTPSFAAKSECSDGIELDPPPYRLPRPGPTMGEGHIRLPECDSLASCIPL